VALLRLYVSQQNRWVAEHHGLFPPCYWSIATTATEMPATGPATMGTTRRAWGWMGNVCSPLHVFEIGDGEITRENAWIEIASVLAQLSS
jgi:hypothetical protein